MTAYPQTLAQWSLMAKDVQTRSVLNTLLAQDPLLGMIPLVRWPSPDSKSVEQRLNVTGPTTAWVNSTTTREATKSTYKTVKYYLSQLGNDIELPLGFSSLKSEELANMVRSAAQFMRGALFTGGYMTEANVVKHPAVAATPYVDTVTAVTANMPGGYGWLKYTHSGTFLQFRAPGSTSYGAQVACAADGTFTVADGDDTTKSVSLTLDISDLAADTEWAGLEFVVPEQIGGLKELAMLDSNQVLTVGTNGDAISLAQLDELRSKCLGPDNEKLYICNDRTERSIKSLLLALGGTVPRDATGRELTPGMFGYNGIPIVASPGVGIAETQNSCTSAGRIYCVRLNKDVGFHWFYDLLSGPNMGTASTTSDDDAVGGAWECPVYLRCLGESQSKASELWRLDAQICAALKNSKSCAVKYGVTN